MMNRAVQPLLELRENELVHHGLARQQEALFAYAQEDDTAGVYDLYSQAVGSAVLIPSWDGDAHRYYLMTHLSEVQWLQREDDEAVVLWDFRNEVVVVDASARRALRYARVRQHHRVRGSGARQCGSMRERISERTEHRLPNCLAQGDAPP